jgi:hypothetical protein
LCREERGRHVGVQALACATPDKLKLELQQLADEPSALRQFQISVEIIIAARRRSAKLLANLTKVKL